MDTQVVLYVPLIVWFDVYQRLSCHQREKLLTGYGELMLAEFKYGLVPAETFSKSVGDQATPKR